MQIGRPPVRGEGASGSVPNERNAPLGTRHNYDRHGEAVRNTDEPFGMPRRRRRRALLCKFGHLSWTQSLKLEFVSKFEFSLRFRSWHHRPPDGAWGEQEVVNPTPSMKFLLSHKLVSCCSSDEKQFVFVNQREVRLRETNPVRRRKRGYKNFTLWIKLIRFTQADTIMSPILAYYQTTWPRGGLMDQLEFGVWIDWIWSWRHKRAQGSENLQWVSCGRDTQWYWLMLIFTIG